MTNEETQLYQFIGENLLTRRKALDISQVKLADLTGMSRASISNIEAGRQHASLYTYWCIAQKLKVELTEIIPSKAEFYASTQPIALDEDMLAKITEKVNGDPKKKRVVAQLMSELE